MVAGTTASGFKFEIDEKVMKDARYLRRLARAQRTGDEFENLDLLAELLGEDQYEKLCEHVEDDGLADIEKVTAEFREIMESVAKTTQGKN